ncbi:hypothetical protein [Arthrobacter sp. FW306-04-A]|uniref:hypothetical protein n=1 Tax=Arthrobacter sp. FW306-04-A TaxID=2879619 RepID=UPI0037C08881|nr:hypothetical protein LFT43_09465 [Arthrobacter sp. FW306-04-A]
MLSVLNNRAAGAAALAGTTALTGSAAAGAQTSSGTVARAKGQGGNGLDRVSRN